MKRRPTFPQNAPIGERPTRSTPKMCGQAKQSALATVTKWLTPEASPMKRAREIVAEVIEEQARRIEEKAARLAAIAADMQLEAAALRIGAEELRAAPTQDEAEASSVQ